MTSRINTAMRNRQADYGTDAFDGGTLTIRTGAQPASANDAATGTVIATITLPTPSFGAAATGVAAKAGTWQATASASGIPGWGRFSGTGGTVMDISVGHNGSGADMEVAELATGTDEIIAGGTVTVSTFTFTQPAG